MKISILSPGNPLDSPYLYSWLNVSTDDPDFIKGSHTFVEDYLKAELVIIPGGNDVHPHIYNSVDVKCLQTDLLGDTVIMDKIEKCVANGIPIIGICKGAQLLACAVEGGKLYQDANNHNSSHYMEVYNGKIIEINSSHHQMIDVSGMDKNEYIIIGRACKHGRLGVSTRVYIEQDRVPVLTHVEIEPEVLYFPKLNGLAVQYHPEWSGCPKEGVDFVVDCFNLLLKDKVNGRISFRGKA